jgi:hypothetical protein
MRAFPHLVSTLAQVQQQFEELQKSEQAMVVQKQREARQAK